MFKIIRESFKITNGNIITATPLIFFSLISSLYLLFTAMGNNINALFSLILFFLMFGAFLAGWFYMLVIVVKDSDIEDRKLIGEFPAGVGEYFLNVIGLLLQVTIFSIAIIIIAYIIGKNFIGTIGISADQIAKSLTNTDTLKEFVNKLSPEQLVKINAWNILLFCTMLFNYFILIFYPAALFFKEKNPFKAFFISLKDTFGHKFFSNVLLFLFIFILYMTISGLTIAFGNNIFVHFVLTLLNFYFVTFAGILVFNYYYSNFVKIGSNIDTTV